MVPRAFDLVSSRDVNIRNAYVARTFPSLLPAINIVRESTKRSSASRSCWRSNSLRIEASERGKGIRSNPSISLQPRRLQLAPSKPCVSDSRDSWTMPVLSSEENKARGLAGDCVDETKMTNRRITLPGSRVSHRRFRYTSVYGQGWKRKAKKLIAIVEIDT